MNHNRITAILLISGAVIANVAFAGLGAVFNYPDILQAQPEFILQEFVAREGAVVLLFALLALSAALLGPIAIMVDRLDGTRRLRTAAWIGIGAAFVQVVGLSRWILIVPGLSAPEDVEYFKQLHTVLGTVVGETFGYMLTGLWTILVLRRYGHVLARKWFSWIGYASAVLILAGVPVPFGLPVVDLANFIGYILWSIWLIAFAVLLWNRGPA